MAKRNEAGFLRAARFLDGLGQFSYDFDLARIKKYLAAIGNPQDKIKTIHVAGTNGKGSVCAYISEILRRAGYRAGLYTSPHLLDVRERIRIKGSTAAERSAEGEMIPKRYFSGFIRNYRRAGGKFRLTYFELLTAMAFKYFYDKNVDFAVIETGLGGRLDATNILKMPLVSVITNIGLEHTKYLGNTVKKIAREKAGIIKENGIIVTGVSGAALSEIKKTSRSKHARILKNPP